MERSSLLNSPLSVFPANTRALFTAYVRDLSGAKKAEEAAREADRRKDEFLSMLAHELRSPLAPILNSLHVARQPETSAADREQALAVLIGRFATWRIS